jgi:hypothetical protein
MRKADCEATYFDAVSLSENLAKTARGATRFFEVLKIGDISHGFS